MAFPNSQHTPEDYMRPRFPVGPAEDPSGFASPNYSPISQPHPRNVDVLNNVGVHNAQYLHNYPKEHYVPQAPGYTNGIGKIHGEGGPLYGSPLPHQLAANPFIMGRSQDVRAPYPGHGAQTLVDKHYRAHAIMAQRYGATKMENRNEDLHSDDIGQGEPISSLGSLSSSPLPEPLTSPPPVAREASNVGTQQQATLGNLHFSTDGLPHDPPTPPDRPLPQFLQKYPGYGYQPSGAGMIGQTLVGFQGSQDPRWPNFSPLRGFHVDQVDPAHVAGYEQQLQFQQGYASQYQPFGITPAHPGMMPIAGHFARQPQAGQDLHRQHQAQETVTNKAVAAPKPGVNRAQEQDDNATFDTLDAPKNAKQPVAATPVATEAPQQHQTPTTRRTRAPRKDKKKADDEVRIPHLTKDPTTGLFFTGLADAREKLPGPSWRYPANDNTKPTTDADKEAWIRRLVNAFMNLNGIQDKESGPVLRARWRKLDDNKNLLPADHYYGGEAIEKVCWMILDVTIRLHEEGPGYLDIQDQELWKKAEKESNQSFQTHMEALIDLFQHFKNRCDKMMKGDAIVQTILTAHEAKKTAISNRGANDVRQLNLKIGRAMNIANKEKNEKKRKGKKSDAAAAPVDNDDQNEGDYQQDEEIDEYDAHGNAVQEPYEQHDRDIDNAVNTRNSQVDSQDEPSTKKGAAPCGTAEAVHNADASQQVAPDQHVPNMPLADASTRDFDHNSIDPSFLDEQQDQAIAQFTARYDASQLTPPFSVIPNQSLKSLAQTNFASLDRSIEDLLNNNQFQDTGAYMSPPEENAGDTEEVGIFDPGFPSPAEAAADRRQKRGRADDEEADATPNAHKRAHMS